MKPIYQWIIKDNQQFMFDKFKLTDYFFSDEEDILLHFPCFLEYHSIIEKYEPSKIDDDKSIKNIRNFQGTAIGKIMNHELKELLNNHVGINFSWNGKTWIIAGNDWKYEYAANNEEEAERDAIYFINVYLQ
jgi:hypothetical protein